MNAWFPNGLILQFFFIYNSINYLWIFIDYLNGLKPWVPSNIISHLSIPSLWMLSIFKNYGNLNIPYHCHFFSRNFQWLFYCFCIIMALEWASKTFITWLSFSLTYPSINTRFYHVTQYSLTYLIFLFFRAIRFQNLIFTLISVLSNPCAQSEIPSSLSHWEPYSSFWGFSKDISSSRSFILSSVRSECSFLCGLIAFCSFLY